jgi:hypothetical protein
VHFQSFYALRAGVVLKFCVIATPSHRADLAGVYQDLYNPYEFPCPRTGAFLKSGGSGVKITVPKVVLRPSGGHCSEIVANRFYGAEWPERFLCPSGAEMTTHATRVQGGSTMLASAGFYALGRAWL